MSGEFSIQMVYRQPAGGISSETLFHSDYGLGHAWHSLNFLVYAPLEAENGHFRLLLEAKHALGAIFGVSNFWQTDFCLTGKGMG